MSTMSTTSVAPEVRKRVLGSRDRFWRPEDFDGSPDAVAQALSRLARSGEVRRVRRGLYWRGASTRLGMAPPPPGRLAEPSWAGRLRAGRMERGPGARPVDPGGPPGGGRCSRPITSQPRLGPLRQPGGRHQASRRATASGRGRAVGSAAGLGRPRRGSSRRCRGADRATRRQRHGPPRPGWAGVGDRAAPGPRAVAPPLRRARTAGNTDAVRPARSESVLRDWPSPAERVARFADLASSGQPSTPPPSVSVSAQPRSRTTGSARFSASSAANSTATSSSKAAPASPRATGWWSASPKTSTSSSCQESGGVGRPTSS